MKRRRFRLWLREIENSVALLLGDGLLLLFALIIGNYLLYIFFDTPISVRYSLMIIPTWWAGAIIVGLVPGWGLGSVEELRRSELLLLGVFMLATLVYFFSRELILPSRIVYIGTYAFAALTIPFGRALTKRILIRFSIWGAPAAIYGDEFSVKYIVSAFSRDSEIGYLPAAIYSEDLERGEEVEGVPVRGGIGESTTEIPVAIVSLNHFPERKLTSFVDNELADYQKLVLLPNINEDVFTWIKPRNLGGLVGLELTRNLLLPLVLNLKSMLEIFIVLLLMPLWLPLTLVLALMIFLVERERPFFLQERIGRYGERFKTIKFRTMKRGAEAALQERLAEDPELRAQWEADFKLKEDPRITRFGAFLRRHSLDELPQLFNVLFGEMSLVGPRPLPDYHHNSLSVSTMRPRYRVRPGMTGLWQVSGRSSLELDEMEKLDTFYVRNWSIWLDIVILAHTIRAVFSSRGAY